MELDKLLCILQKHNYSIINESLYKDAYKDDNVFGIDVRIIVKISNLFNGRNSIYLNAYSSHGHHLSYELPLYVIITMNDLISFDKVIVDFEKEFSNVIENNISFYKLEMDNPFYNEAIQKEQQDCFHRMMDKTQMAIDDKTIDVIMPVNDDCDDACCLYYTTKDYLTCEDISHIRKSEFSKLYINSKVYDTKNENMYLYLGDKVFKKLNSKEIPNIKTVENKKSNKDRKPSNKIRTYKKI